MSRILVLLLGLIAGSCSLDPFLYNQERLDHYDLSTAVVLEWNRRTVTCEADADDDPMDSIVPALQVPAASLCGGAPDQLGGILDPRRIGPRLGEGQGWTGGAGVDRGLFGHTSQERHPDAELPSPRHCHVR